MKSCPAGSSPFSAKLRLPHSRYFFERSRLVVSRAGLCRADREAAGVGKDVQHLRSRGPRVPRLVGKQRKIRQRCGRSGIAAGCRVGRETGRRNSPRRSSARTARRSRESRNRSGASASPRTSCGDGFVRDRRDGPGDRAACDTRRRRRANGPGEPTVVLRVSSPAGLRQQEIAEPVHIPARPAVAAP